MTNPDAEEREYLAARARLVKWRKADLARRLAEIPKATAPKTYARKPIELRDPLNIGFAGTSRRQRYE